jgi:hypothetical protein
MTIGRSPRRPMVSPISGTNDMANTKKLRDEVNDRVGLAQASAQTLRRAHLRRGMLRRRTARCAWCHQGSQLPLNLLGPMLRHPPERGLPPTGPCDESHQHDPPNDAPDLAP